MVGLHINVAGLEKILFLIIFTFESFCTGTYFLDTLYIIKYINGISGLAEPEYKSTSCSDMSPNIKSKTTKAKVMTWKHDNTGLWCL